MPNALQRSGAGKKAQPSQHEVTEKSLALLMGKRLIVRMKPVDGETVKHEGTLRSFGGGHAVLEEDFSYTPVVIENIAGIDVDNRKKVTTE